jgi:SAM-dependent methyltransferase/uncharacterized protein YbaR (Trm112 family)
VKPRVVDWLACPVCEAQFDLRPQLTHHSMPTDEVAPASSCRQCLAPEEMRGAPNSPRCEYCYSTEVDTGVLVCGGGHVFPVLDGVPRLTLDSEQSGSGGARIDLQDTDASVIRASFGWEWENFAYSDRTWGWTVEERADLFLKEVGVTPEDLVGRTVLDAGCGNGSLSRALNGFGCEVVAADVSDSVVAAHRHFASLGNNRTHFIQADLLHPPFRGEAFDLVYSSGVLHHTPSTRRGVEAVVTSLAPGGTVYVWVYGKVPGLRHQLKQRVRRVVARLPGPLRRGVMRALLGQSLARRRVRRLLGSPKPQDDISRSELMVLLLDQYTPRYRWEHTPEQVHAWYRDLGLSSIATTEERSWGFGVAARKPIEPGSPTASRERDYSE